MYFESTYPSDNEQPEIFILFIKGETREKWASSHPAKASRKQRGFNEYSAMYFLVYQLCGDWYSGKKLRI